MLQQISLVCPLCWQTAGEARSSRQCCSPACKLTHPPAPTHFPPHDPKWWIVLPPQTQTVSVIHWLRRCLTVDDRQQNSGRPARPASTKSMTAEAANVSDLHPPADVRGTLQLLLLYLKTLQLMLTLSALLLPLRKSAGCSHSTPPARRCHPPPPPPPAAQGAVALAPTLAWGATVAPLRPVCCPSGSPEPPWPVRRWPRASDARLLAMAAGTGQEGAGKPTGRNGIDLR